MKISIHRALAQLKTTRSRFFDDIGKASFISYTVGMSGKAGSKTVAEAKEDIRSDYDRIKSLLENFRKLRMAVTRSNSGIDESTSNISYADSAKQMTVAEIVAYQTHVIPLKRALLREMTDHYNEVSRKVEVENERVSEKGMLVLTSTFGGKDSKNIPLAEVESFMETYKSNNALKLVDPLDLKSVIDKLSEEVDEDTVWADSALSEANALRTIEVAM